MSSFRVTLFIGCCLSVALTASGFPPEKLYNDEMPDGIYRVVPDDEGRLVNLSIGGQVDLGERLSENFGDVSIWSISNQNDQFAVWMKQAGPADLRGPLAICVEGVCQLIESQEKIKGSDKVELIAFIKGKKNVQEIASTLKAEIIERKHPGYLFVNDWKPVKEQFQIGEPVTLELSVKNVGSVPVHFKEGGENRGARDNQFGFTAFSKNGFGSAVPDTGDPMHFGGKARLQTLKPGDVFCKQVDITKWFKFETADSYRITGTYDFKFYDQNLDGPMMIWEDFVTGRCVVKMVE